MEIEKYRQSLLTLERELVRKIERDVETARESVEDQPDPGDRAMVDELREEYFALAQTDSGILTQVRAALGRIANGTFGRCMVDGGSIEEERLDAVPWTPYCARHQREAEEAAWLRTPRA